MYIDVGMIGVPAGFYSITEDPKVPYYNFLSRFYNDTVRHAGRQLYVNKRVDGWVVYTYTVGGSGHNFADIGGRGGSFFGITIGVKDNEITRPEKMFQLLDSIYENSVRGNIISDNGTYKKWILHPNRFADGRQFIEDAVMKNFNNFIGKNDIKPFKFNQQDNNAYKYVPPVVQQKTAQTPDVKPTQKPVAESKSTPQVATPTPQPAPMSIEVGIFGASRGFVSETENSRASYRGWMETFHSATNPARDMGKRMLITRRDDNYVLYTFTIGADGHRFGDGVGRPGSLFGITLAVKNGQFINPDAAYKLMDYVYENSVRGKFIHDNGKDKRWMINNSSLKSERAMVERAVADNIGKFVNMNTGFRPFKFNPNDNNADVVYAPDNRAKQFDAAIAQLKDSGIDLDALAAYIAQSKENE